MPPSAGVVMSLAMGTGAVLIAERVVEILNSLKYKSPLQHHTTPFHSRSTVHGMAKCANLSQSAA